MKQKPKAWLGYTALALLLLGLLVTAVLASEGIAAGVMSGVGPVTEVTLRESVDLDTWEPVLGGLTEGYSLTLDGEEGFKYLDVESLLADPLLEDGRYAFYFDHLRVPEDFWTYWADQGVDEEAEGGWEAVMWEIINGNEPIFYLDVSGNGTSFTLVDGLLYQLNGTTAPLRVNRDYPLGTYHFGGSVTDQEEADTYLNIQITFTQEAVVSLTADTWTIDGCGYLDVFIHLANMHDLYALDIELEFDTEFLEAVDLVPEEEDEINLLPINDWFQSDYIVYFNAYNQAEGDIPAGTIRYVATQKRGADPVEGEGAIAMIRFRAKAITNSAEITVTKAEFSDRDGFLIGRPAEFAEPAAEITTEFTADAGLDLDIIRLDADTVQLQWPMQQFDTEAEYILHRSTLPYFELGDAEIVLTGPFVEVNGMLTYDDEVLGKVGDDPEDEDDEYFFAYGLQIACSNEFTSPLSDQVGKIEFELFETATTDFTWIGLVLEVPGINTARDLAEHIKANNNSSGVLNVEAISRWNPIGQNFTTYAYNEDIEGFSVEIKQPYRVDIDLVGVVTGSAIWAQVGRLPEITRGTYTLHETSTTSFNWILQPLDMVHITNTTQLAEAIEADFIIESDNNGEDDLFVKVEAVARWNPIAQGFSSFVRPASSDTRFGYPYRISVDIADGDPVVWPVLDNEQ